MVRTIYLVDYYYDYYASLFEGEARRRGFALGRFADGTIPGRGDVIIWTDVRSYLSLRRFLQLLGLRRKGVRMILVLFEPPVVHPYNYWRMAHLPFDRIYTWNDRLVDGKRYRKFLWQQDPRGRALRPVPFEKRKLLTIFCANKRPAFPRYPRSLYEERVRAMRFFDRAIPRQFDIYGRGWDLPATLPERILGARGFRSWKGWVDDKLGTLKRYRFSICYENMRGKQGYITEKVWDSLKARCVPIYWGAQNISQYLPEGTYIDRRAFEGDAEVLALIKGMRKQEHDAYVRRIDAFVRSREFEAWSHDAFARRILEDVQ